MLMSGPAWLARENRGKPDAGRAIRCQGLRPPIITTMPSPIQATATYVRTETRQGRVVRHVEQLRITVPAHEAHLVRVDERGHATLALTPRYEPGGGGEIAKIETPPEYDEVPTIERLLDDARMAAITRAAHYERRKRVRRDEEIARKATRAALARRFLDDPSARASTEPPPMLRVCWLLDEAGSRVCFRATDPAPGHLVPPEARRRYHADSEARKRARQAAGQDRAEADQAVRRDREAFIREWVLTHGTRDQRERFDAGVLPWNEVIRGLEATAWAPIAAYRAYEPIQLAELQTHVRARPAWAHVTLHPAAFQIDHTLIEASTPAQSKVLDDLAQRLPDAALAIRRDQARWTGDTTGEAPVLVRHAVRVTLRVGPFTLKRLLRIPGEEGA